MQTVVCLEKKKQLLVQMRINIKIESPNLIHMPKV